MFFIYFGKVGILLPDKESLGIAKELEEAISFYTVSFKSAYKFSYEPFWTQKAT